MRVTAGVGILSAIAPIGLVAGLASADTVKLDGGPGYGGGSFVATITREVGPISGHAAPFSPFGTAEGALVTRTFCAETGEHFVPGTSYFVQYSTTAMNGGTGGAGDPLGTQSAWLYSRAVSDPSALASVFGVGGFNITNANQSRAVQEALWKLEGESYTFATGTIAGWREALITLANTNSNGSLYGVMFMRLWDTRSYNSGSGSWDFSGRRQDQFVMVPLPPAAWAGLGTIAAVIGFGYIRRRSLRQE